MRAHSGLRSSERKVTAELSFFAMKTSIAPAPGPNSSQQCSKIFIGLVFNGRKGPIAADPTDLIRKAKNPSSILPRLKNCELEALFILASVHDRTCSALCKRPMREKMNRFIPAHAGRGQMPEVPERMSKEPE